jgi:hypothetical protein
MQLKAISSAFIQGNCLPQPDADNNQTWRLQLKISFFKGIFKAMGEI